MSTSVHASRTESRGPFMAAPPEMGSAKCGVSHFFVTQSNSKLSNVVF
jgi:hypothetical protein